MDTVELGEFLQADAKSRLQFLALASVEVMEKGVGAIGKLDDADFILATRQSNDMGAFSKILLGETFW